MHLSTRFSVFLTAAGMALVALGLILPSALSIAGAQASLDGSVQSPQASNAPSAVNETDTAPETPEQQRNPFVPDVSENTNVPDTSSLNTQQALMPKSPSPEAPGNETTASVSSHAPAPVSDTIVGIIVGDHPYVLVSHGEKTHVLSVGDRISGRTIARISLREVRFTDNSTSAIPLVEQ
jgi:hypothetical protein